MPGKAPSGSKQLTWDSPIKKTSYTHWCHWSATTECRATKISCKSTSVLRSGWHRGMVQAAVWLNIQNEDGFNGPGLGVFRSLVFFVWGVDHKPILRESDPCIWTSQTKSYPCWVITIHHSSLKKERTFSLQFFFGDFEI